MPNPSAKLSVVGGSLSAPRRRVQEGWGEEAPDWVIGLADACAETSQNRVAKRLGVSAAMISNVIGNKYSGDLDRLRDLYLGAYKAQTVQCPALGTVQLDVCRSWRERSKKFNGANARNVMMFKACNRCPINKGDSDA